MGRAVEVSFLAVPTVATKSGSEDLKPGRQRISGFGLDTLDSTSQQ